ncbi:methylenetetrahydrofolate reductase [Campylobacter hyointestinalis]|uniref:Methylenetetrahydrofolate reductase n=1 Tax=Campylobacter hyointestinalis subsp. hyointestinalis TaxID=91352 RepID=A0A855NBM1_CAMHY|nr:methylenetetrahydrofolate reductase [Campylobacter hyointestinalis]MDL2346818.1 methylenetetrahydrofolate reductase [Campylobacter hyointestinalis]MDL2348571.1 methylenetetrahydrofolate reductase [Campylobacter hyointestinalis]MDL2350304.1 methylenetetrahydrofolate reductase [Campylobacter hyointestinalis]MDM1026147.1 methylenetetrahydrofolate reductase [Campylobacter hyointestinalis]MDM1027322.1 methylenetetrahydrofolate reductase [Campylobacter hyointestinalis]
MLKDKIKENKPGILLYGITPPKINLSKDEAYQIAKKQLERLENTGIDGLVIYDLQDESARNDEKRTFEFCGTIKPEIYHKEFLKLSYPAVIYKAVGNYTKEEFANFLNTSNNDMLSVFVGASSKNDLLKFNLNEAYKLKKEQGGNVTVGGICIPERHEKKGDEDLRVASKIIKGCEFFITQAVYNIENAKRFLDDYANLGIKKVPIIFTFTPCGSPKTLEFMRWLGISVSKQFEDRLFESDDPLSASVGLSLDMFEFLYKYGRAKGVSVGANVESISTRKVEIEASINLLRGIKNIIQNEKEYNLEELIQSASKFYE